MKKIMAAVAALAICMAPAVASASGWADHSGWNGREPLDMYNNELFTIIGEVSEEELMNIPDSLSPNRRDEKYAYNDGLKKDKYEFEGYNVTALYDIDGNLVYDNPVMQLAASPFGYFYNLGYIIERDPQYNMDTDTIDNSITFINMITGEKYYFNSFNANTIENDGTFFLSVDETFYKAQLKKPAIVTVFLDGQKLYFDQLPVIDSGRTLVPLRTIFEELGATVEWEPTTSTVTATKDDVVIELTVGSTDAKKNGETITIDAPARVVSGRTLVPVRFIADCFGVETGWNAELMQVLLESK